MGLAEPKKRRKISHDPNNTAWTRSTTTYGHKILRSQGWEPGSFLGAANAPHATHYTAANASHVRVLLKDDNLGLGAKRIADNGEQFGMEAFQGILGRLNGKCEEDVAEEEVKRKGVERQLWVERKLGGVRFVRGGLLVGDQTLQKQGEETGLDNQCCERSEVASGVRPNVAVADRSKKEERKGSKKKAKSCSGLAKVVTRKDFMLLNPSPTPSIAASAMPSTLTLSAEKDETSQSRQAKKLRKEARRAKKEERRRKEMSQQKEAEDATRIIAGSAPPKLLTSAPGSAGHILGGRHAVRQRYIEQKRLASANPQALKEIFMVKA